MASSPLEADVQTLLFEGRMKEALERVESARLRDGDKAEHYKLLAEVQTLMQRPQLARESKLRALSQAEARLASDSQDARALAIRAWVLSDLGPAEELIAALQQAQSACSNDLWLGLLALMMRVEHTDVASWSREAERMAPRGSAPVAALMMRAAFEKNSGHPQEAMYTYSAALQRQQDLPLAMVAAANCAGLLGSYEAQLSMASRAASLRSDLTLARIAEGEAHLHLGNYSFALRVLDQAVKLQEDAPTAHFLRAEALMLLGHNEESLAAFQTAIRLWPLEGAYHANMAKLHAQMNRWDLTLAACDEALKLDPSNPSALHDREVALARLGAMANPLTAERLSEPVVAPGRCSACQGLGRIACLQCQGSGRTRCMPCNGTGKRGGSHDQALGSCFSCFGNGSLTCVYCGGTTGSACISCAGSGRAR